MKIESSNGVVLYSVWQTDMLDIRAKEMVERWKFGGIGGARESWRIITKSRVLLRSKICSIHSLGLLPYYATTPLWGAKNFASKQLTKRRCVYAVVTTFLLLCFVYILLKVIKLWRRFDALSEPRKLGWKYTRERERVCVIIIFN